MATINEQVRDLWGRYYMVTLDMLKFIDRQKIDEFLELVSQRKKLGDMLDSLPDTEYRQTRECQVLFEKIRPLDMQIIYKAKSWLNKSKRQNLAVRSYDLIGNNPLGHRFNHKY
jgi:hypothetical protein